MADGEKKNEGRANALQKSYSETTAWLIAENKEAFDAHRAEVLKGMGIDWSPPLTQEQKDAALVEEIRLRSPGLFGGTSATPPTDPHS